MQATGKNTPNQPDDGVPQQQQRQQKKNGGATTTTKNVRVVGRIRPLAQYEIDNGSKPCVIKVPNALNDGGPETLQINEGEKRWFELDAIMDSDSTQLEVYEQSGAEKAISEDIFQGFNCTILAYGQTGAGKTFTMGTALGADDEVDDPDAAVAESAGLIPRACHDLFQNIKTQCDGNAKVECSYMEVYNEEIRDLLSSDSNDNSQLRIRETLDGQVYVRGLQARQVTCPSDVGKLMEEANGRRVVASTKMNATSSRSHALCVLKVTGVLDDSTKFESKLTLVDLAGSERLKKTEAKGNRAQEGISINKGLFVLGQVVSALAEQRPKFKRKPPFRDSKLTRLLQDSLGGNSRTIMIACCSPADFNLEETVNTLRYATQARNIKNSATANVVQSISQEEAMKLKRENQLLKREIEDLQATIKRLTQDVTQEDLERSVAMITEEISMSGDVTTSPMGSPVGQAEGRVRGAAHDLPPTPELEHPDPEEEEDEEEEKDEFEITTPKAGSGGLSLDAHFNKSSLEKAVEKQQRGDEEISLQVDDVFDTHSYMSGSVVSPRRRRDPTKPRSMKDLEEENVELEARLRLAERDVRAAVHETAIENPELKKRVQELEESLNESHQLEAETLALKQELEEAKADKESAQRAAEQLAAFMEQQKKEFGFRGDELEKKRLNYFRKRLDERWTQFVVTILSSFKEQMRLLGDYYDMVVKVTDSPDILSMLGTKTAKKLNNEGGRRWWNRGGGGDADSEEVKQEKELRNRLLQEHIKFFNDRLLEIEDEINTRSESVDDILDALALERKHLESELEATEFAADLFSKKGEKLLNDLTTLMTGPLFNQSASVA